MISPPVENGLYALIQGLVNPKTGLVVGREGEEWASVYGNALATMAFSHEWNFPLAEKIIAAFDKYCRSRKNSFEGLPNMWESGTGLPSRTSIAWEVESAMLLLAIEYYRQISGMQDAFLGLAESLAEWLVRRTRDGGHVEADGVATIFAALLPFKADRSIGEALDRSKARFFSHEGISSADYRHVLAHIAVGALVFGDPEGFKCARAFRCSELREGDPPLRIEALSDSPGGQAISVDHSSQLLLAWRLWRAESHEDYSYLRTELEKLLTCSISHPDQCGLPHRVSEASVLDLAPVPSLEPTCWYLFSRWRFNPYAPGRKSAGYAIPSVVL